MEPELDQIRRRYERRNAVSSDNRYSPLNPAHLMCEQEKERALVRWIVGCSLRPVSEKRVLEVGCGGGRNLLQFLRLGFSPKNLVGVELLEERVRTARAMLPAEVQIVEGDAATSDVPGVPFDIVLQSTVFSSILDGNFRRSLANRMWSVTKPGGGILWYDFVYDNPRNCDVRGVPPREIRSLFPSGDIISWRVTLAPPISRVMTRLHPSLYGVFNAFPFLRTHVLCWIVKAPE